MDLRFKNRRAMVTVELAVTLVLIVVALFVTLGLFNNNLRDMVANSNIKNLFNGNGARTLFSFFNKDYKNAQVYVQIMGEQGLQILRKKANNGVVSAVAALHPSGGNSVPNNGAFSTISYLSQIITVIMGNQVICDTMITPSIAECGKEGVPSAKYIVSISGTSLSVSPAVGNSSARGVTITTTGPGATFSAAKNASGFDTKDKFNFISGLASDNVSSSNALMKTIGYFNTVIHRNVNQGVPDNVDTKVKGLIIQIDKDMQTAHDSCIGHTWIGDIEYQKTWVSGCGSDPDVVNDSDLESYKAHSAAITETLSDYSAQVNCIVYPNTQGCTPTSTTGGSGSTGGGGGAAANSLLNLPLDPKVLPTYSANGNPTPLPDVVALASYKNVGAVTAGIPDALVMTNPLGDTSNMMAKYACRAVTSGSSCPAGEYMATSNCCMPNGVDANGNPISSGTSGCGVDRYLNSSSGACTTCPASYTDGGDGDTCICSNGGTFNVGTGACSVPVDDGTGTVCLDSMYKVNGVCIQCPFGLAGNGVTCTCPTNSRFYIMPDGYGTCQCSSGTFDSASLTCTSAVVDLATIATNICQTGVANRCDSLIIQVPTTDSKGNAITIQLLTQYIASPLNDSLLSALKTSNVNYLRDRVRVLALYNRMLDAIWNGPNTITADIGEDNYNNPKACDYLKATLLDIAKNAGLLSMGTDISAHLSKCTPGGN